MIELYKLPTEAVKILVQRIVDEQQAFYFYISAAAWCRLNSYEYSANYFEVESRGEEWHYKKIIGFLSDWNEPVEIGGSTALKNFKSLQDIFEQAYYMELDLYKKYESDAKSIFDVCQNTYNLMRDFVSVQNDSVIGAAAIINKMENYLKADPGLILFDKEVFEQYYNIAY